MGEITQIVRRYVPATYRAMVDVTNSSYYTSDDLQALADYVKFRLFATVAAPEDELTAYNPTVRQFIGKLTTIQFIPAAIDFWDAQIASKNTTGTSEVVVYREHREGLIKLLENLTNQVEDELVELGFTIGAKSLVPRVTYGDNGRGILITEDPQTFPPTFGCGSEGWPRPWPWVVDV